MSDMPMYCLMNYSRAEEIFRDDYRHVRSCDLDSDMMLLLSWWSGSTAICMSSLFTNSATVAACLGSSFRDGDLAVDSSPESLSTRLLWLPCSCLCSETHFLWMLRWVIGEITMVWSSKIPSLTRLLLTYVAPLVGSIMYYTYTRRSIYSHLCSNVSTL